MGLSIIIPLMTTFAARFGADPLVIGILQAAYRSMRFIGTPILGRLSDRFGRKPICFQPARHIRRLSSGSVCERVIDFVFAHHLTGSPAPRTCLRHKPAVLIAPMKGNSQTRIGTDRRGVWYSDHSGADYAYLVLAASGGVYRAVALTAACFSLMSILMTTFLFHETNHDDSPSATKLKSPFIFSAMLQASIRPTVGYLLW